MHTAAQTAGNGREREREPGEERNGGYVAGILESEIAPARLLARSHARISLILNIHGAAGQREGANFIRSLSLFGCESPSLHFVRAYEPNIGVCNVIHIH